jgi:hypothetical protein
VRGGKYPFSAGNGSYGFLIEIWAAALGFITTDSLQNQWIGFKPQGFAF